MTHRRRRVLLKLVLVLKGPLEHAIERSEGEIKEPFGGRVAPKGVDKASDASVRNGHGRRLYRYEHVSKLQFDGLP